MDERIRMVEKGTFCFLVNLKNYLNYYHLTVSESWLSGMASYMGFFYTSQLPASKEVIHGRNGSFAAMYERLASKLKMPPTQVQVSMNGGLLPYLGDLLRQGYLPLIWINDLYLDHSLYFELADYWSLVVVQQVSEEAILYFDNAERRIETSRFLQAVNSRGIAKVCFTTEDALEWKEEESGLIASGLEHSLDQLTNTTHSDGKFYGLEGMRQFAQDLQHCTDSGTIYNYFFQINRPGGLPVTRETMFSLLKEMGHRWPALDLLHAQELYKELSNRWRLIGNLLFKLSRFPDKDLQERIVMRVHDARAMEERGVEALQQLIDHIRR